MIGWLFVAVVLLGGVGALAYVALGEKGGAASVTGASGAPANTPEPAPTVTDPPPPPTPVHDDKAAIGSAGSAGSADAGSAEIKTGSDGTPARGRRRHAAAEESDDAEEASDPSADRRGEPRSESARAHREGRRGRAATGSRRATSTAKLEKIKGYGAVATYKQAYVAFESDDMPNAQRLAEKAAQMKGAYQLEAKVLFADATFQQGDYKRAKSYFVAMRNATPKIKANASFRATLAKKIAACNKALKLADDDGIGP